MPEFAIPSVAAGLLYAFALPLAMCVVAGLVHLALSAVVRSLRRSREDSLTAELLNAAKGPLALFFIVLGLMLAYFVLIGLHYESLDFLEHDDGWGFRIWLVIVTLLASYLGSRVLQTLMTWYVGNIADQTATDLDEKLLPQIRRITPVVVYSIGVLMALDIVGISITPLIAGLGIGGIAVALALQPTLSNLFSGTYMITEGELNEGDFIEMDGGPSGFVVDVGWRSTKIRDRFNNLILIPNSKLSESVMTNYNSQSQVMSVVVECGVSYESDLAEVERIALDVANGVKEDLEEAEDDFEPVLRFTAFGESNIDFVVVLRAEDRVASFVVKHELIKRLHGRFGRERIEINYPVRKLVTPPQAEDGTLGE